MSIYVNLTGFEIAIKLVFGGGAVIDSAGSDPAPYPAEVGSVKVVIA